ncbi:MAG: cytidine deaminase [Melioribacteraceae bacterium]|nr:cytidine deaminase [Melioribacteraceae bacterium]
MTPKELMDEAKEATKKSHAPYSNFHVGAALLTEDGKIYQGANIETSSYSLTICAERTALFSAFIQGERKFKAIAITSDQAAYCPPCGACRQVLLDLCGKDLDVILLDKETPKVYKISELLPHSFGEEFLNK